MNISEQHSLHDIDVDSLRSVVGAHLSATLLDSEASDSSLHLPLIAPEVVKLSGIRPNDDSQEQIYNNDGIGISQRYVIKPSKIKNIKDKFETYLSISKLIIYSNLGTTLVGKNIITVALGDSH